jgi:hypothetical protein
MACVTNADFYFYFSSGGIGEEVNIGQSNSLKEDLIQLHTQETPKKFTSVTEFTRDALSELVSDSETENRKGKSTTYNFTYEEDSNENTAEIKGEFNAVKRDCAETDSTGALQFQNETSENVYTNKRNTVHIKNVLESQEGMRTESSNKTSDRSCEILNNFRDVAHDNSVIHNIASNTPEPVHSKTQKLKPKKNRASRKKSLEIPLMTNAVLHIEKCLREWFTIESMCFLFGEENIKEIGEEKGECIKE